MIMFRFAKKKTELNKNLLWSKKSDASKKNLISMQCDYIHAYNAIQSLILLKPKFLFPIFKTIIGLLGPWLKFKIILCIFFDEMIIKHEFS